MASLCLTVSKGILSITLSELAEGEGKSLIIFGAKKALTSILSDGTEKKLDQILSKLDELHAAINRLSNEIKAAIAEGDLKEIEAKIKSMLLACKEKSENETMTIDDAQKLLEVAFHLHHVTTGKTGVGLSGSYFETVRHHCFSNGAGTNIFQFWETFTTLTSYYASLLMAVYGALGKFEAFQQKAGDTLQTFLEQVATLLGTLPQVMENVYGPDKGKKSVIINNKSTGAELLVSGGNRWYLHQIGGGIWFRFANQQNGTGIDHWYGRDIREGEPGATHNNHLWTLIVIDAVGSDYYFNIRNDATGRCLDHYYGKLHGNGRPVLSTAGTPSHHINHLWRLNNWE